MDSVIIKQLVYDGFCHIVIKHFLILNHYHDLPDFVTYLFFFIYLYKLKCR